MDGHTDSGKGRLVKRGRKENGILQRALDARLSDLAVRVGDIARFVFSFFPPAVHLWDFSSLTRD